MINSDIAVIEQQLPHSTDWEVLAYIGPDRSGGEVEIDYQHEKPIRIRYLNRPET